jgi:putative membrane protein
MMHPYWSYPWGGFGLFSWLPAVVFWLVLLFVVARIFRHPGHRWEDRSDNSPLDILKERYAKGEIDKKQFEEMKKAVGEK